MRRVILVLIAVMVCMIGRNLSAQELAGDWQGTLKAGNGLRTILHIDADGKGGWTAKLYSIDQGPEGILVDSMTLTNGTLKFSISLVHGSYEGKLSADGNSISGTWTQGSPSQLDLVRATQETLWSKDASPHTVQFITVEKDVKLEVLDWGGTGKPLVFLAGLGNTAHIFDKFAPKFTAKYHVYGITRRGFGESSSPVPDGKNYSSDRLGDDVLAVDDALKLDRPVLAGHSIAGEELSSIGARHPEKASGLIYLDAGYAYAFYDSAHGDLNLDMIDMREKLAQYSPIGDAQLDYFNGLLKQTQQLEKDLQEEIKRTEAMPPPKARERQHVPFEAAAEAILAGEHKYTKITVPCLVIFAVPHDDSAFQSPDAAARAKAEALDLELTTNQSNAFEAGVPSVHMVRLAKANHFVFFSNEADVLREMNTFLEGLH